MDHKICLGCLKDKSLRDYYDGSAKFGKQSRCMECYKAKVKEWQGKNRVNTKTKSGS